MAPPSPPARAARLVPAGVASAPSPTSWAAAEIRALGQDPAAFRPDDTVTRGELAELIASATATAPSAIAKPGVPLSIQDLDARLVAALGLATDAQGVHRGAKAAGLAPPSRFGTEAVARLLGAARRTTPRRTTRSSGCPTEPGLPSRGGLLRRPDRPLQRLGARAASRTPRPTFASPRSDRLAAPDPRDRVQARRLPVRLGRHERQADRSRWEVGPRRLRLLGLRLARLQAPGLRRPRARSPRRSTAARPTR